MAYLQRFAHVGPLSRIMGSGGKAIAYQTSAPLGANGVFNTPDGSSGHIGDPPDAGDFIAWGGIEYIRVRLRSDHNSAANGILIETTDDGVAANSVKLLEATYTASAEYNSGWIAVKGLGFRFKYTNAATPQTSFFALVEVSGDPDLIPPP